MSSQIALSTKQTMGESGKPLNLITRASVIPVHLGNAGDKIAQQKITVDRSIEFSIPRKGNSVGNAKPKFLILTRCSM